MAGVLRPISFVTAIKSILTIASIYGYEYVEQHGEVLIKNPNIPILAILLVFPFLPAVGLDVITLFDYEMCLHDKKFEEKFETCLRSYGEEVKRIKEGRKI